MQKGSVELLYPSHQSLIKLYPYYGSHRSPGDDILSSHHWDWFMITILIITHPNSQRTKKVYSKHQLILCMCFSLQGCFKVPFYASVWKLLLCSPIVSYVMRAMMLILYWHHQGEIMFPCYTKSFTLKIVYWESFRQLHLILVKQLLQILPIGPLFFLW